MTVYEIITAYWTIFSALVGLMFLGIVWALDQKSEIKALKRITTFHTDEIKSIKAKSELFEGKIFDEISRLKEMMAEINGYFKAMFKEQK